MTATTDSSADIVRRALDPSRSVVVEACAGSGKTWLLASRIVRLLLAGVAPGEVLAITFTRKAAREIEERVVDWLQLLATGTEAQVVAFLSERGVVPDEANRRKARGLYESVLAAQPGLAVNTFHGWFLQLVDAAPLSANLSGATLVDSDSRLFDEMWQSFAGEVQKTPESALAQSLIELLDTSGLEATCRLMRRALDRRSEWLAFGGDADDIAAKVVGALRESLGVTTAGQGLEGFFSDGWPLDFQAYLGFLELSELKTDQDAAANLRAALLEPAPEPRFEAIRSVLLTRENTLRAKKPGKALDKRFTVEGAARFLDLHALLGVRVLDALEQMRAERIVAFNEAACSVFQSFLRHVNEFKRARRQIDFVDAEWNVLRLLRDEATAAFLQARLDARYSHVLLDEFQDTNPLQWQILLAWLDAYSDDSRPGVFLVGDPKQSIYRFRRAEPRLFSVASEFLVRDFSALRCEQDATRRNAIPIIDVVNALFLDLPEFLPFRAQTSFAETLPGRVELLPLFAPGDESQVPERTTLRDPLSEADVEPEDRRLRMEAEALAGRISEMVGCWQIEDRGADGRSCQRAVQYGDIMLLVRTRANLAIYERALSAAAIPFDAGSRGGLLQSLEVRDMVALLEFLVTPVADLRLAHVLRCPVVACSDDDLMALALRGETSWWLRLQALVAEGSASPRLVRAAGLLAGWLQAADRLPAHDLLDRIFHQGEVIERYRLAAPAAAAAGVEANLRALLLLALDLDGGRYPSLPRFIDELRELRDADANDAPDEGVIETQSAAAGRVRILTIHGAKGLEAPIVWLLGANASPRAADAWDMLIDWPPEASLPRHVSFFGLKEDRGAARLPIFDAEALAAKREELNLLYVAITRARQVFMASGIENAKERDDTPYRRLETALTKLGATTAYGDELPKQPVTSGGNLMPPVPVSPPLPAIGERRPVASAAERFGVLLHALLERQTEGGAADGWWVSLGFDESEYRRVLPVAEKLLRAPELQRFFVAGRYRRAWNEVDVVEPGAPLQRIDRLVEFDDSVWVLDYKSSGADTPRIAEYRAQVAAYCRAVRGIFAGRDVRGALVFSDASILDVV